MATEEGGRSGHLAAWQRKAETRSGDEAAGALALVSQVAVPGKLGRTDRAAWQRRTR